MLLFLFHPYIFWVFFLNKYSLYLFCAIFQIILYHFKGIIISRSKYAGFSKLSSSHFQGILVFYLESRSRQVSFPFTTLCVCVHFSIIRLLLTFQPLRSYNTFMQESQFYLLLCMDPQSYRLFLCELYKTSPSITQNNNSPLGSNNISSLVCYPGFQFTICVLHLEIFFPFLQALL